MYTNSNKIKECKMELDSILKQCIESDVNVHIYTSDVCIAEIENEDFYYVNILRNAKGIQITGYLEKELSNGVEDWPCLKGTDAKTLGEFIKHEDSYQIPTDEFLSWGGFRLDFCYNEEENDIIYSRHIFSQILTTKEKNVHRIPYQDFMNEFADEIKDFNEVHKGNRDMVKKSHKYIVYLWDDSAKFYVGRWASGECEMYSCNDFEDFAEMLNIYSDYGSMFMNVTYAVKQ